MQLNDSQVNYILDAFLTTPGVSQVGDLNLRFNQLTRVPTQTNLFNQLKRVDLEVKFITSIDSANLDRIASSICWTVVF